MKINQKIISAVLLLSSTSFAAQLDHSFSSPSFSGIGYSSHVLTIKQLEDQARSANKAAADALKAKAESDAANTPQAQFVANLQSRIYSQLALNITNTLFGATGQPSCGNNCGGTLGVGGNTITWSLNPANNTIQIKIVNQSNPSQYTSMTVPIGTFAF